MILDRNDSGHGFCHMEPELCKHEVAMLLWQASELFPNWEYCSSWAGNHYRGLTDLPEAVTVLCEGCQVSFSWCAVLAEMWLVS